MGVKAKAEKGLGYAHIFQSQDNNIAASLHCKSLPPPTPLAVWGENRLNVKRSTAVTKSRMKGNFHVRFGSGGEKENLSPTITNHFHLSRENPSSILSI
jgi:hypothetical protein